MWLPLLFHVDSARLSMHADLVPHFIGNSDVGIPYTLADLSAMTNTALSPLVKSPLGLSYPTPPAMFENNGKAIFTRFLHSCIGYSVQSVQFKYYRELIGECTYFSNVEDVSFR